MEQKKYTPTPWQVGAVWVDQYKEKFICLSPETLQDRESRDTICLITSFSKRSEIDDANAAHIVHCVNSYDSLVEQNRVLREALEGAKRSIEMYVHSQSKLNIHPAYQKILSALKDK